MKPKKLSLLLTILPMIIAATGCHSRQESKADITPHCINLQADTDTEVTGVWYKGKRRAD